MGFFSYERCIITTFGLIDRDFELGVWYRLCLFNLLQNTWYFSSGNMIYSLVAIRIFTASIALWIDTFLFDVLVVCIDLINKKIPFHLTVTLFRYIPRFWDVISITCSTLQQCICAFQQTQACSPVKTVVCRLRLSWFFCCWCDWLKPSCMCCL